MKKIVLFFVIFFAVKSFAQETKKSYQTKFTEQAPVIDAFLDDEAWQNANIATNFVMVMPGSGTPEPENLKTEVKIVYDHNAIYFSAYLHDDKPYEIPMEFQTRDNFGNADFFGIVINPSNDGINQTEFFVMSTGNQNDAKATGGREDFSWNAVWYSKVRIVDDGWIVEMKIPYSALRFSNEEIQTWSINFHRRHQKTRDQYTWNFIPKDKGSSAQYDGILTGIKNIQPPVRLSFSPYASASIDEYEGNYEYGWSAGLDLKYGLSESFTLDATLIPDFGQTAYDEEVLNLSPFETKYSEKRPFFTEGVDLFSKGDLFYSRRVGGNPYLSKYAISLKENESISEYPSKVGLLNAIKLSGRTSNGLGIGFFNAVTEKTVARIEENINETISERELIVDPLTNYNVLVLDQQFNKNSSVTFVNTNVFRKGDFRDADVSALLFDLKTKNSKYGVSGGLSMSNMFNNFDDLFNKNKLLTGFEGSFEIGKVSGKHQFDAQINFQDDTYSKRDLGYQRMNNVANIESSYSYRIFEPKGMFNQYGFYFWTNTGFVYKLDKETLSFKEKSNNYTGTYTGVSTWATTKKQLSFGGNINLGIGKQYDYYYKYYFSGRFYKTNPNLSLNAWLSTDYSKPFSINYSFYISSKIHDSQTYVSYSINPRYRISNHIQTSYNFSMNSSKNTISFIKNINDIDLFGKRDRLTIENTMSTKYNFNTKSSLGLNFRYYWSRVNYAEEFYKLKDNGSIEVYEYSEDENIRPNIWNFDLNYSWEFAPGSQLSILYRNSAFFRGKNIDSSYYIDVKDLFDAPLSNQLSFKLIYYLDYNSLRN